VTYTIGELFAGIGGFSLAFHATGQAHTAWFVEKEPYCQQVLHKHWPTVPIYGDIYDCHNLPHVDILTAGFPCQPFSIAGSGQGDSDKRYLVSDMLRIIQEAKPHVVFLENVPRFRTLDAGIYFRRLLRTFATLGYDAQWGYHSAQDVGAPYLRDRWFCVAFAVSDRYQSSSCPKPSAPYQKWNLAAHQQGGHTISYPIVSSREVFRWRGGRIKSRLGRNPDGLPARLDGHQWPARPGQAQFDWEPSRTTTRKQDRANRLKALGNAVVPQVVLPIATAIVEWLDTQSQTGQEEKIA